MVVEGNRRFGVAGQSAFRGRVSGSCWDAPVAQRQLAQPPAEITCLFRLSLWGACRLRCYGRKGAFAEEFHGGLVQFVAELGALVSLGDIADREFDASDDRAEVDGGFSAESADIAISRGRFEFLCSLLGM